MKNTNAFMGILSAAAIGAGIGMLFAPSDGPALRKKISKKGDKYAKTLNNKFDEAIENFSKKFENMSKEADKMAIKIKSNAEELKTKIH